MQNENPSLDADPFTSNKPFHFSSPIMALGKILLRHDGQFAIIRDNGKSGHGGNDDAIENIDIISFLAETKMVEILAALNYKYIAFELRPEFQPLIDKVADGEITPEQFVQAKQRMYMDLGEKPGVIERDIRTANLIKAANAHQIKILAVDTRSSDLKAHSQFVDRRDEAENKFAGIGAEERSQASWQQTENEILQKYTQDPTFYYQSIVALREGQRLQKILTSADDFAIAKGFMELRQERLSGHRAIAESIKLKAEGKKTLVFYGSSHTAYNESLDTFLENALIISPYVDEAHFRSHLQSRYIDGGKLADFGIILESGTIYTKQAMDQVLIKNVPLMPAALMPHCTP